MSWRVARSLLALRAEVDALAPGRSKRSDGTIGDASHRGKVSDHNPNSHGVVCALDLTHDPAKGADMAKVAEWLRAHRNPALKYLIFRRRIASAKSGWRWRAYTGPNPHTGHLHVSVGGPYDNADSWSVARAFGAPAPAKPSPRKYQPGDRRLRRGMRGDDVAFVQRWLGIESDGIFGPVTQANVRRYQAMRGIKVDGIVGPVTWRNMGVRP